ncbi:hypothetical protein VKT23_014650 [Stygiomarasmius scandens]|uniref:Uncharacterized protein n=1 Tax=Marasmiellus scandens TaxID=2682957 RepID=A0ABR1IZV1_9AGAR
MDDYFDVDHALNLLENLQLERNRLNFKQSQSLLSPYQAPQTYHVVTLDNNNEPGGYYQETIFRLQGVVYEKELPPLKNIRDRRLQPAYIRQHVGITGLGLTYMTEAIDHLHQIFAHFQRTLKNEELTPWSGDHSCERFEGITASCRYFTVGSSAFGRQSVPFQNGVDPDGLLRRMLGDGITHTEENVVLYMKATKSGPESKWRYREISPSIFSIGDIVEIQFTVMVVRQKEGNHKMITVLKSLTLLDDSVSVAATVARNKAMATKNFTAKPSNFLKRLRYEDCADDQEMAEEAHVRKGMARLRIQNQSHNGLMNAESD